VSVDFEGEVLQGVAVPHGIGRVLLGQTDNAGVLGFGGVVLDDAFADLRDM
jgi:hypothetical protein